MIEFANFGEMSPLTWLLGLFLLLIICGIDSSQRGNGNNSNNNNSKLNDNKDKTENYKGFTLRETSTGKCRLKGPEGKSKLFESVDEAKRWVDTQA